MTIKTKKDYDSHIADAKFKAATDLGNVVILWGNMTSVQLETLLEGKVAVAGLWVEYNDVIDRISLPSLKVVNGSLDIISCSNLESVHLPALERVGGLAYFVKCDTLASISAPLLSFVGGTVSVSACDALKSIAFPALEYMGGLKTALTLQQNKLASVLLPKLQRVSKSMDFHGDKLVTILLPLLQTVGKNFYLSSGHCCIYPVLLRTLDLPSLATVGGVFQVSGMKSLVSLNAPRLTSVHQFQLPNNDILASICNVGLKASGIKETNVKYKVVFNAHHASPKLLRGNDFEILKLGGVKNPLPCPSTTTAAVTTSTVTTTTVANVKCVSGQYRLGNNPGTCRPCSHINCGTSQYREGTCSTSDGYSCNEQPKCSKGTQYLSESSIIKRGTCAACINLQCSKGQYRTGGCEGILNLFKCVAQPTCNSGEYLDGANPTQSGTCKPQTICQKGQFLAGATVSSPGQCKPCASVAFQPARNHRQTACQPFAVCKQGQFEVSKPTSSSDRVCGTLGNCATDQYQTTAPTTLSNRECATLTLCKQGERITVPAQRDSSGNAISDLKCGLCKEGEYQDRKLHRESSCKGQPQCPIGEYLSGAGSTINAGLCTACSNLVCQNEQYQSGTCQGLLNGMTCNACDNVACGDNEYRTGTCTGTLNLHQCTKQPMCNTNEFLVGGSSTQKGECQTTSTTTMTTTTHTTITTTTTYTTPTTTTSSSSTATTSTSSTTGSSSTILVTEARTASPHSSPAALSEQAANLFAQMDISGNGKISVPELVTFCKAKLVLEKKLVDYVRATQACRNCGSSSRIELHGC